MEVNVLFNMTSYVTSCTVDAIVQMSFLTVIFLLL